MGNCQAVEAATLVIQHPCGKVERMYWPLSASDVMKTNPGHYVSLIIPLPDHTTVRVKLLRPTDTLLLGRAYRLVTTQEVVKVLRAKKHANMRRNVSESHSRNQTTTSHSRTNHEVEDGNIGGARSERHRQRAGIAGGRPKSWRPSLQSISEATS